MLTAGTHDLDAGALGLPAGTGVTDWVTAVRRAREGTAAALTTGERAWSGDELLARANSAASWLAGTGSPEGRPIPVLLQASPKTFALILAGAATRRPLAPLSPWWSVPDLVHCVRRLGASCLVTEPDFEATATAVTRELCIDTRIIGDLPGRVDPPLPTPHSEDAAVVLHTTGTAGHPRPVAFRHDRLARRCELNANLLRLGPGSVFATVSPIHRLAGLGTIMVAMAAGATYVATPQSGSPTLRDLDSLAVTHALLSPMLISALLRDSAVPLRNLQVVQYGTAPVHAPALRAAMTQRPDVSFIRLYGQVEGSPISWLSPEDHRLAGAGRSELLRSAGRAVPGTEIRIGHPDRSGLGEVTAQAGHLFAPSPDGWLRTGDLGRLDNDGYLYLAGRRGDTIAWGGHNVHPLEVESRLVEHPGINAAAVTRLHDSRLGEVIKAFVVLADPDNPPSRDELRATASAAFPGAEMPLQWEFVPSLPRSADGQLLRDQLVKS
jgi:acyl-CoA synthetase (AMP-forming)/AMP-acid ligase II